MNNGEVRALVDEMLSISPEAADRDAVSRAAELVADLQSFATHYAMRCSRRANELKAQDRDQGGFELLLGTSGSARDAKAAEERDRVCSTLPVFDDALAAGDVSAEHVDVLAKHTKDLTDDERAEVIDRQGELATTATGSSAWNFERRTKEMIRDIKARHRPRSDAEELAKQRAESNVKEWTEQGSGMKCTLLTLDPQRHRQMHAVVEAKLKQLKQDPANAKLPFDQLKVDAWLAAVTGSGTGMGVPEVSIHTDSKTADEGAHEHTLCELDDGTPIPVSTMQRFLCDAIVRAVFVEPDGTVRRIAEMRTPNRAQRRALEAMHATCAHPECSVPITRCKAHHIVWYSKRGPTLLDNLVPLCEQHHHLVHEGGWGIAMTPDRTVTWTRPDGTLWRTHPSADRRPRIDRPRTDHPHTDHPHGRRSVA